MDLCGTKTLFRSKLKVTTRKLSLADVLLQSIQISTAKKWSKTANFIQNTRQEGKHVVKSHVYDSCQQVPTIMDYEPYVEFPLTAVTPLIYYITIYIIIRMIIWWK